MVKVQSVDRRASFLFHHQVIIMKCSLGHLRRICTVGLRVTLPHYRGAEPTHIEGGDLELILTDVLNLVRIRVCSPAGLQIIVPFLWMCAGATYSPQSVQSRVLSQELCEPGACEKRCDMSQL